MDQKTWAWRKISSDHKTILTTTEDHIQAQPVHIDNVVLELENSLKTLNEKLQMHEQISQNATSEKNKAENETLRLRQELDKANERLLDLNAALKETMQNLKVARQEQEASKELEKSHAKSLASLTVEASYLRKALVVKERLIEDLNRSKFEKESEHEVLVTRLDSVEKENALLRYEYCTIKKVFDLKSEEVEVFRKQHLEDVKRVKKLESECQKLVRGSKRLHGVVGGDKGSSTMKVSSLVDRVCELEKENRSLRECLAKKELEMEIFLSEKVERKLELAVSESVSEECKMIGASDMRLMDDFVEMEKLAIVADDELLETKIEKNRDWIEDVRNLILEEHNVSKRSLDELLGDVRACLDDVIRPESCNLLPISGYIGWKSPTLSPKSCLEISVKKIVELVGRFDLQCDQTSNEDEYKIRVLRWKNGETNTVLQEFVRSCNSLLEGNIDFEKFIEDLSSILGWIIDNCVSTQDHSSVRDEFEKHLGGVGPGTALGLESVQKLMSEMEKIVSVSQLEIEGLKNELEQSKEINEDLGTQLNVTKSKLDEVHHELSSVEVELDDKTHCCEELEGTCLDLRLQLESFTSSQYLENSGNQEQLLRTGPETIPKLGNQLKALTSARELSVVDNVLSIIDSSGKKSKQRLTLHDHLLSENNEAYAITLWEGHISTPKENMKKELKNEKAGALVIVPGKRRGRAFGFIRKLLIRRKKTSSKNTLMW